MNISVGFIGDVSVIKLAGTIYPNEVQLVERGFGEAIDNQRIKKVVINIQEAHELYRQGRGIFNDFCKKVIQSCGFIALVLDKNILLQPDRLFTNDLFFSFSREIFFNEADAVASLQRARFPFRIKRTRVETFPVSYVIFDEAGVTARNHGEVRQSIENEVFLSESRVVICAFLKGEESKKEVIDTLGMDTLVYLKHSFIRQGVRMVWAGPLPVPETVKMKLMTVFDWYPSIGKAEEAVRGRKESGSS